MAKLAFTKLGLAKNASVKTINYNGQVIEVKQYLPVSEKLALVSAVINYSADDLNYANPLKISIYSTLEIIYAYTNINFTEKQKEDPCKLYDLLAGNGLSTIILSTIPEVELAEIIVAIEDSINAVYNYRNSVMGILDTVMADYSSVDLDASSIQQKIADPQNLELLKAIMTKLG